MRIRRRRSARNDFPEKCAAFHGSAVSGIYGGIVKRDEAGSVVIGRHPPSRKALVAAAELGRQYQNHNPRPGPVYAGGGYTPINEARAKVQGTSLPCFILQALRKGPPALKPLELQWTTCTFTLSALLLTRLLGKYPDLANDISTGGVWFKSLLKQVVVRIDNAPMYTLQRPGATPLHMCGMGHFHSSCTFTRSVISQMHT